MALVQNVLGRFKKPKLTGVTCHYCGWNGPKSELATAPVMNEDSKVYRINVCPGCARNGGLVYHPESE